MSKTVHRYKQVYIPTNESWEYEFTEKSHPSQYDPYMNRLTFLELINKWNTGAIFQATVNVSKTVEWLYVAL